MIDLTIKTLDSQNHAFSVDDDITVAQFKEKIAEVINIPVESQRLIYCGRVLQDAKKLQEYDVNGKVVHLVQRAPPSATRRSRSPISNGNVPRSRPFSNAMYLGSMAFPTGLMEAQGMVRPPPTQSLSGSRLAVARRMIRRAENILNSLEGGTRSRESPPEEPQDDVTPVFAAQVNVPHTFNDDALSASLSAAVSAAVSAVENGILQAEQSMQAEPTPSASTAEPEVAPEEPASTASAETSEAAAAEGQNNGRSRTRGLPRNSYGTIEMSRLLDDLNKIHERLQPYMERYHTFMRTDPVVSGEQETRDTQQMINRVSEIMHLLGHAYHSLSDVMVQVSTPAPRPLLCRPILIQHSAVVQAGIPIQVEAQINLTPDRRPSDSNSSQTGTGTQTQTESNGNSGANATTTTTNQTQTQSQSQPQPQPSMTNQAPHMQPNVHEIRIDSFPFEFRGFQRHPMFNISTQARPQQTQGQNQTPGQGQTANQAQGQGQQNQNQAAPPPTGNNDSGSQATETNTNMNANAPAGQQQEPFVAVVPPFSNNPNMEFFMEVTPESITIDSLETTVVTSAAQADNVLRGTFGGVPPEFIQSLVLHAIGGDVMGANPNANSNGNGGPVGNIATFEFAANDNAATTESSQSSTATANSTANGSNVNSQARGNTQTHPTTSTQTRSTARPHEHLAQHTMQGFDPFLPCNSHHIHRRRMPVTATTVVSAAGGPSTENTNAGNEQQNNNQVPNPIYNILQGLLRSLGNTNLPQQPRERNEQEEPASGASVAGSTAAPSAPPPPTDPDTISLTLDFADLTRMLFDNRSLGQSTTLASVLQNFPDHQYTEGDSLFTDLVMTLARGLTFSDVIALNTGHIDPLVRIRPTLRTFFLNRVLEGECPTQAAIDRGANRLIAELQPILELMSTMRVRDNIDIVESATQLCRSRFPNIISLLMSRMTGSLRSLVDLCLLTIRQLCALVLHSCEDGQAGVEEVFRALIARYTVGVSPDIHQWTITTSLTQIRHFLRTLDVSAASIQPYIVIKSANSTSAAPAEPNLIEPEAMECEEAPVVETTAEPPAEATNINPASILEDEADPLPNVVIGSEPWHCGLQTDWIPIITRDNQRQRRQNPQAPFSDAYLSGMPSKRRKIVASAKPQGNLSQVISDGVRRAVTATGLTNAVPLDVVSQAASADLTLQSAYRDLLRTSVQSELRDNPDFTPERFPNAANYFNINK